MVKRKFKQNQNGQFKNLFIRKDEKNYANSFNVQFELEFSKEMIIKQILPV